VRVRLLDLWQYGSSIHSVENYGNNHEEIKASKRALMDSLYMDDLVTLVETSDKGIEIYKDMACYSQYHLKFKKWMSCHQEVLEKILVPDQAKLLEILSELPQVEALCMIYLADLDELTYKGLGPEEGLVLTKRAITSIVARIFYPTGYLDPLTVRARVEFARAVGVQTVARSGLGHRSDTN
jgi:hypothetical protein